MQNVFLGVVIFLEFFVIEASYLPFCNGQLVGLKGHVILV